MINLVSLEISINIIQDIFMLSEKQISDIIRLIESAGRKILKIYYHKEFNIRIKEDNSPVTIADLTSDNIIKSGLAEITPGISIFSEETKEINFEVRTQWNPLWILDPLDGTKEFISKNNEFCISLALVFNQHPIAGFIHAPVTFETWIALRGNGAYKIVEGKKIRLPAFTPSWAYRISISRSHYNESEAAWIEKLKEQHEVVVAVQGSAIKFCRIAEGISDIYPKFGLIHEWDIAAGHIIIEESGGNLIETLTRCPPVYNKISYFQPPFIAFGSRIKDWQKYI
jgi:3'(2'), 5'-bisphosphate nucleotidase